MPAIDKGQELPTEDFQESLRALAETDPAQAAEMILDLAERLESELEASRASEPEPKL